MFAVAESCLAALKRRNHVSSLPFQELIQANTKLLLERYIPSFRAVCFWLLSTQIIRSTARNCKKRTGHYRTSWRRRQQRTQTSDAALRPQESVLGGAGNVRKCRQVDFCHPYARTSNFDVIASTERQKQIRVLSS